MNDFGLKIRSFKIGQAIASKPIKVGSSTFEIWTYPAGDPDSAKGNVSVFLYNSSEWRVQVNFSVKVKGTVRMGPWTKYFNNVRNEGPYKWSGWGEEKFASHDICRKGKNGILNSDESLELEVKIGLMKEEVIQEQKLTKKPSDLQCPICMNDVKPPMRLRQCINGHIICDSCFDKTQGANRHLCHTCRSPMTGRPSQLETLFGLN